MAESANVIERAIRAGHHPRSFLMSRRWLPTLTNLIEAATGGPDGADIPVFVADEDVLEQMTGFHLHRGALAAMQRPILPGLDELLATARGGKPALLVAALSPARSRRSFSPWGPVRSVSLSSPPPTMARW